MSGIPDANYPMFLAISAVLRQQGLTIVSPHEITPDGELTWQSYMMADVAALVHCQYVVLIPGWASSRGSFLELTLAFHLNLPIYYYDPDMNTLTRMSRSMAPDAPGEAVDERG